MKKRTKIILCIVFAALALVVTVYPLVSNFVSERYRSLVETKYTEAVEKMDNSEIIASREAAQAYNATLVTVTEKAYSREALAQAAESYDELLDIRGDGIMGYIEIPKINVNLPIYHGSDESSLERGAGHLLGSSLPVGGMGTHSVITGHSGMAGQRMFSDLENLEIGDVFYIHVLDETIAYMILAFNTVLPEDTSELTVDPVRDSCTLLTCTPYGVNTHRLLVRGERIGYETAERAEERSAIANPEPTSTWKDQYIRGIICGLIGIATLGIIAGLICCLKIQEPEAKEVALNTNWRPAKRKPERRKSVTLRKRGKHEAR